MKKLGRQRIFWQALALTVSLFLVAGWVCAANVDRSLYRSARKEYDLLEKTKVTAENRQRWESLAARFQKISREMPRSPYAADSLFYSARIHYELYDFDKKESSLSCNRFSGLKEPTEPNKKSQVRKKQKRYAIPVSCCEELQCAAQTGSLTARS